ncbi:hypothetical protein POTOM_055264 [Populus tomentosa]|uniref:40S ribosomal protein S7 n=1 Tax=Populus tomentosa TaxID=118781 RepID=A0A8X8C5L2_POPTO|nr:hypothetical protein POTOM_055264 [Populus tomentosa]
MTVKSLAVLNKSYKMRVPCEMKKEQTRLFRQLPSGLNMEVIEQKDLVLADKENNRAPRSSEKNPPLVFVHGSYHAAWCWDEHWLPFFSRSVKMFTTRKKIQKDKDAEPTEFEETVAQALFDLENSNSDLKSELKDLFINSAVQIDVAGNRKAIVIYVPYRLRKSYRKVHLRLVRELEKKFSGKDVVLLATRRIVRPPKKGSAVQRPRSRTLTAVHEAMLEDLVYPAEIVGKRTRYRIDGSKISKIFLDPKERNNTEYKLESYAGVYRKLTGKDVVFDFPVTEA